MKVSFLTAEENQELFSLKLVYIETKRQLRLEQGRAKQYCLESFFAAEIALWRFFQRKLIKVKSTKEFIEFCDFAKDAFVEFDFTYEPQDSFDASLQKFREFIIHAIESIRKKAKKIKPR